jgi:hypothetical protein
MKTKRKCLFCGKEFMPTHGNQLYCSDECKKNQKAATQYKLYGILKEFRKGFLANFKLFEKLLPTSGKKTYTLPELNIYGFKHNCYYGAFTDSEKGTCYKVGHYSFTIFEKDKILSVTILNQ